MIDMRKYRFQIENWRSLNNDIIGAPEKMWYHKDSKNSLDYLTKQATLAKVQSHSCPSILSCQSGFYWEKSLSLKKNY